MKQTHTWPFPPPGGPVPLTPQQIAASRRAQRQQQPHAPYPDAPF